MKADPRELIKKHYETLVDARTGRTSRWDHLLFEGIPVIVAAACFIIPVELPKAASAGLLTVAGVMAAFLFGVMLQIAERAMAWTDAEPTPSGGTSAVADFLEQIAANAGYAALVSIVVSALFVVATIVHGFALTIFSAVGLALASHLFLVLLMVVARIFALIQRQLLEARTGGKIASIQRHRRAS